MSASPAFEAVVTASEATGSRWWGFRVLKVAELSLMGSFRPVAGGVAVQQLAELAEGCWGSATRNSRTPRLSTTGLYHLVSCIFSYLKLNLKMYDTMLH